jgi:anti-sigma factor RsiW
MNNDRPYDPLREANWRRPLNAAEEAELRAWLAAHPEAQADWEAELALSDALRRLPEAPLASNFTSRVLQAVEREAAAESQRRGSLGSSLYRWLRLRWLPRVAVAAVFVVAGLFSYRYVADQRRAEQWARPLEMVSGVPVPNAEVLEDFDAIQAFNRAPAPNAGPDEELLSLLQ